MTICRGNPIIAGGRIVVFRAGFLFEEQGIFEQRISLRIERRQVVRLMDAGKGQFRAHGAPFGLSGHRIILVRTGAERKRQADRN
jgi:hypothetical protein